MENNILSIIGTIMQISNINNIVQDCSNSSALATILYFLVQWKEDFINRFINRYIASGMEYGVFWVDFVAF